MIQKFVSHFWRTLWRKLGIALQFNSSYHPQIDEQTEVVNWSLGNLLRSFVEKNIRQWDILLAQDKFAYNWSTSQTTGHNPFEVVYGLSLLLLLLFFFSPLSPPLHHSSFLFLSLFFHFTPRLILFSYSPFWFYFFCFICGGVNVCGFWICRWCCSLLILFKFVDGVWCHWLYSCM